MKTLGVSKNKQNTLAKVIQVKGRGPKSIKCKVNVDSLLYLHSRIHQQLQTVVSHFPKIASIEVIRKLRRIPFI